MRFLGQLKPTIVGELYKFVADEINTTFGIESTVDLSFDDTRTFNDAYDDTVGEFGRQIHQAEKRMKWQLMNGESFGQGMFY